MEKQVFLISVFQSLVYKRGSAPIWAIITQNMKTVSATVTSSPSSAMWEVRQIIHPASTCNCFSTLIFETVTSWDFFVFLAWRPPRTTLLSFGRVFRTTPLPCWPFGPGKSWPLAWCYVCLSVVVMKFCWPHFPSSLVSFTNLCDFLPFLGPVFTQVGCRNPLCHGTGFLALHLAYF